MDKQASTRLPALDATQLSKVSGGYSPYWHPSTPWEKTKYISVENFVKRF